MLNRDFMKRLPKHYPVPEITIQASCSTNETARETAAGGSFTQTMFQIVMTSTARGEDLETHYCHLKKALSDSFDATDASRQHPQFAQSGGLMSLSSGLHEGHDKEHNFTTLDRWRHDHGVVCELIDPNDVSTAILPWVCSVVPTRKTPSGPCAGTDSTTPWHRRWETEGDGVDLDFHNILCAERYAHNAVNKWPYRDVVRCHDGVCVTSRELMAGMVRRLPLHDGR